MASRGLPVVLVHTNVLKTNHPRSVLTVVLAAERVLVLEETDWASLVLTEPRRSAVKTSRGNGVGPAHPGVVVGASVLDVQSLA